MCSLILDKAWTVLSMTPCCRKGMSFINSAIDELLFTVPCLNSIHSRLWFYAFSDKYFLLIHVPAHAATYSSNRTGTHE